MRRSSKRARSSSPKSAKRRFQVTAHKSGFRFVFSALTKGLLRRPNLAKALVRSLASGDPNITERVASFHALVTALVMAAISGEAAAEQSEWGGDIDERERTISSILQNVWFASFVGWAGGLHDVPQVLEDVDKTTKLLLAV